MTVVHCMDRKNQIYMRSSVLNVKDDRCKSQSSSSVDTSVYLNIYLTIFGCLCQIKYRPLWTGAEKLAPKGIQFPERSAFSERPADFFFLNLNEKHTRYLQNIFILSVNHGFYSTDFLLIIIAQHNYGVMSCGEFYIHGSVHRNSILMRSNKM